MTTVFDANGNVDFRRFGKGISVIWDGFRTVKNYASNAIRVIRKID